MTKTIHSTLNNVVTNFLFAGGNDKDREHNGRYEIGESPVELPDVVADWALNAFFEFEELVLPNPTEAEETPARRRRSSS